MRTKMGHQPVYILGINAIFHESAACLIKDGQLVAAVEEERFNRIKHGKQARLDNPDELPLQSIKYCCEYAGIGLDAVDYIGYSASPKLYEPRIRAMEENPGVGWCNPAGLRTVVAGLGRIPERLQALGFAGKLHFVEHHLAHAASAFFVSPFTEAAVLAVDGIGEKDTALFCHGQDNVLHRLESVPHPHSLGFMWECISLFLGFDMYDAAKVMGLAAYGDPARFAAQFGQLAQLGPQGMFFIDDNILHTDELQYYPPSANYEGFTRLFGVMPRRPEEPLTAVCQDIAAALQQHTNKILLHAVKYLHERTGANNLCLAGGVALNCVSNSYLFEQGPFDQLFVQPSANDAGTAIGAAYFIWHQQLKQPRGEVMQHAYLGPEFSDAQIAQSLQSSGLRYRHTPKLEEEVAQLLTEEKVVGLFQGRMELGPRALGNRSLIADPRNRNMREILNHKVKHREYFRPLAPSVLSEQVHRWFVIAKDTSANDFMLMTYPVQPHQRDRIPAVLHVDGSSRIQTVQQKTNPRYHAIISEFCKLTGVPVVLNTSFNDSEPIVCTPDDGIHTFVKTDIDYLAIGNFVVSKAEQP